MVEQVGRNTAIVQEVLPETEEMFGIPGDSRREFPLVTEPHIPVDVILSRHGGPGGLVDLEPDVERAALYVTVIAAMRPGDFSHLTLADHLLRIPILLLRCPLGADLELFVVTLDRIADLDGLFHREGHRFFAVDMLAGFHGLDAHLRMPVVRSCDEHGVYILALEQLTVIEIAIALADCLGFRETALVNIADRENLDVPFLAVLDKVPEMAGTHTACPDDSEGDTVIGAEHGRWREAAKRQRSGYSRAGFDEGSTGSFYRLHCITPFLKRTFGPALYIVVLAMH